MVGSKLKKKRLKFKEKNNERNQSHYQTGDAGKRSPSPKGYRRTSRHHDFRSQGFRKNKKTILKDKSRDEIIEHENKTKLEIVVPDELAENAIKVIQENARTGGKGDGKIFLSEVLDVVKIRTGGRGRSAI